MLTPFNKIIKQVTDEFVFANNVYPNVLKNNIAFIAEETIFDQFRKELNKGNAIELMNLLAGNRPVKENETVDKIIVEFSGKLVEDYSITGNLALLTADLMITNSLQTALIKTNSEHGRGLDLKELTAYILDDPKNTSTYTVDELLKMVHPQGGGGGLFSELANKLTESLAVHEKK